jgi:hypothetical protein
MRVLLPDIPEIPEAECTPLVRKLLEVIYLGQECIQQLQERIQQLEDEVTRLKGLKARPEIAPSSLEKPPRPPRDPGAKRPGSAKRSKTAELIVTAEEVIPVVDKPTGSIFKGYEDFIVQDLELKPRVIRYRREHWMTPDGHSVVAPLPADVPPGSHFGSELISYILHQYHHQHVTQPLLLEQLQQLGFDISAGELSRILTEGKDVFHQEKAELLPVGLAVSPYIQVDDTGARHQGHNGAWPAPRKLVQPKWESLGKVTPGGTHEKAKERRRGRAITTRSRPRSGQRTDHLGLLSQARHRRDDVLSLATAA